MVAHVKSAKSVLFLRSHDGTAKCLSWLIAFGLQMCEQGINTRVMTMCLSVSCDVFFILVAAKAKALSFLRHDSSFSHIRSLYNGSDYIGHGQ